MRRIAACLTIWIALLEFAAAQVVPDRGSDTFAQGYAAAMLERDLRIPMATVFVADGVLTLRAPTLASHREAFVREVLGRIAGVRRVDIVLGQSDDDAALTATRVEPASASLLSRTPLLFREPLADPRWPHFSAAIQAYRGSEFDSVAAVTFGESFSFYRAPLFADAEWEIGFQAGVFAIFDLNTDSFDLVNADYTAGPVATIRRGSFSMLARLHHQSSHLGDEYLLRTQRQRINLSYEVADALLSWEPSESVRVYGGGGYIVHSDTQLERWTTQFGLEYIEATSASSLRPVFGIDLQAKEFSNWNVDVSVRAGVQFQDRDAPRGRVQLLFEYYNGRSPNGQFSTDMVEWFGLGAHFYF